MGSGRSAKLIPRNQSLRNQRWEFGSPNTRNKQSDIRRNLREPLSGARLGRAQGKSLRSISTIATKGPGTVLSSLLNPGESPDVPPSPSNDHVGVTVEVG
jgi:hypothetical protein